jgi:serine/threonine protein kinase
LQLDRDFHPKLGDFGLSRLLANQDASVTNMEGTPSHMAPELLQGPKHNPIKADVYSYGMLLYELATFKVSFYVLFISFHFTKPLL